MKFSTTDEKRLARSLYEAAVIFYQKPENVKNFKEWKDGKSKQGKTKAT